MAGTDNMFGAILLTLLAGLSTSIGGAFVFFSKSLDTRVLSVSLYTMLAFFGGILLIIPMPGILENSLSMYGLVGGKAIMPLSLWLLL
jgi:zinc transporter ZupT